MDGCNIVTGSWLYEPSSGQLVIEPESTSDRACSAEYPPTATPVSGKVALDGAELRLAGEEAEIVAVDTAALPMLEAGDLAGRWVAPEVAVEFGERGLLRVGDCTGSWSAVGGGISMQLDDGNGEACSAESMWTGGGTVIPARHDNTLLLRFDRPTFPLDRDIVRLELAEASGSPLLDGP